MRPTLALAMITLNSEKNLPVLFESISGCFDKIYITNDSKTTDETRRIAQEYNCILTTHDWCDDFSMARNASFEPVKEDYVMWMDSDDVLTSKDNFIHWRDNFMETRELWMAPYYYVPGLNIERERVVKRSLGMKWKYFVHECIDPNSGERFPKCGRVHDWSVNHTRSDFEYSNNRNLRLFDMNKNFLCSRMKWAYGKELYAAKRFEEAVPLLESALQDKNLDKWDRQMCSGFLTLCKEETSHDSI